MLRKYHGNYYSMSLRGDHQVRVGCIDNGLSKWKLIYKMPAQQHSKITSPKHALRICAPSCRQKWCLQIYVWDCVTSQVLRTLNNVHCLLNNCLYLSLTAWCIYVSRSTFYYMTIVIYFLQNACNACICRVIVLISYYIFFRSNKISCTHKQ